MPRLKTLKVAALNITTQPHSPENYINLFKESYKLKATGKIRGSDWGIIGSLYEEKGHNNVPILRGMVYRFLNIDPKAPWLDLESNTPIDEEQLEIRPIVPDHLKPNLKMISYVFYPKFHRFFFSRRHISPGDMMKLMNDLFKDDTIATKYGQVDVSVESTSEAIERILAIPRLTRLHIMFNRPNDDDLGGLAASLLQKIDNMNIRKLEQTATSTHEAGIKPDDETQALMKLALSNGRIEAKGYDAEQKVEISTDLHPFIEQTLYNPEIQTEHSALLETSEFMLRKIKGNK
jgi:hypothetical protein